MCRNVPLVIQCWSKKIINARVIHTDPVPYQVTKRKGNQLTAEIKRHRVTRNLSHFKKVSTVSHDYSSDSSYDDYDIHENVHVLSESEVETSDDEQSEVEQLPMRSGRVTGQPLRYPMDVSQ